MAIERAFRWLPVPVIRSNWGTFGFDAFCYCIFIVVKPSESHRRGLIAHELQHVQQIYTYWVILFAMLYLCSAKYRYKFELEAYRAQITDSHESVEAAANDLATKYNIDKTYEQCVSDLLEVYGVF